MSIQEIKNALRKSFQGVLKNIVSLANDSTLESDLKVLKIGEENTKIQLSKTETKLSGKVTVHSDSDTVIKTTEDITLDAGSALELTAGGDITLDADGGDIYLKDGGSSFALFDTGPSKSRMFLYEAGGSSTDDYFYIDVRASGATSLGSVDAGGAVGHLTLVPDGELNLTPATEVKSDAPLKIKEASDAVADTAAYGQLWVKTATPNQLYFTTDAGDDIQLTSGTATAGGGGTSIWTRSVGGYKTNNNSATNYYFNYYNGYYGWTSYDSSPTTLTYSNGSRTGIWHSPADGTLTNIRASLYASDSGATDPLRFYVFKGTIASGAGSASTTLIGTSDAITPVVSKTMFVSTDISSSNTFSEGDTLWCMLKKDSTSGNQDVYFSVTISGEFD